MSTPAIISEFNHRVWNGCEYRALVDTVTPDFTFRGTRGVETKGREGIAPHTHVNFDVGDVESVAAVRVDGTLVWIFWATPI